MTQALPNQITDFMDWSWSQIEPHFQQLEAQELTAANVDAWLASWTHLLFLISERGTRLRIANTQDTTDPQAEADFHDYIDHIHPQSQAAHQKLKEKLLASGLEPQGMRVPLRKMRSDAVLFRTANLSLLSQDDKLSARYNKIIGAQTVEWEGKETTLQGLRPVFYEPDRARRERAWRLASERQLADRAALNALYGELLALRGTLAANADLPDYRAYRWQQMQRLDYTPADAEQFQQAILEVAVPAATRVYQKHASRLGLDSLRPWDLDADLYPVEQPALPSYGSLEALESICENIFEKVSPRFGGYFRTMRRDQMLDLDNRKGKAPGAYCAGLPVTKRPFILMNAVGLFSDLRTLLHEAGHAFHNFETFPLPYAQQRHPGLEFSEVASMSMELLTYPYLDETNGGIYSQAHANRARVVHLERILTFWPYMAVVDAFQHWVYTHPSDSADPANCDRTWLELWQRYLPGVDWSGLDEAAMTGWHRKQHIFRAPFYYVEYGVAQLGSVQVWSNALRDQEAAVEQYRQALALGGTATLPELYQAAGGKFAFDAATLRPAVELVERKIAEYGG